MLVNAYLLSLILSIQLLSYQMVQTITLKHLIIYLNSRNIKKDKIRRWLSLKKNSLAIPEQHINAWVVNMNLLYSRDSELLFSPFPTEWLLSQLTTASISLPEKSGFNGSAKDVKVMSQKSRCRFTKQETFSCFGWKGSTRKAWKSPEGSNRRRNSRMKILAIRVQDLTTGYTVW